MKHLPLILLLALSLLFALWFVGCNRTGTPADTTTAEDTTVADETTKKPKETEPPAPETEPLATGPVEPYGEFELVISEPTVVYQARETVQGWGKHQFPNIGYTKDGLLRIKWSYGEDKVGAKNESYVRVSMNGGKTWLPGTSLDTPGTTLFPMTNGKSLAGFVSKGVTYELNFDNYTPVFESDRAAYYLLDDLKEDPAMTNAWCFAIREYDPATGKTETVEATLHWPWGAVAHYPNGSTYTTSGKICQDGRRFFVAEDGTLYTVFYEYALDHTASTLEEALGGVRYGHSALVFYSKDCGRNWYLAKQFIPTAEIKAMSVEYENFTSDYEGFTESNMIQTASGGFMILMRSGSSRTLFCSYSEDGMTWSDPRKFDDFGVLPQLLTMDCGVLLASYGRPELRVRATSDPTAVTWQDPVTIPVTLKNEDYWSRSCFYTGMLQIDANTAMLVYTDFQYPNKQGNPARAVLVRTIHVVPKSED